MKTKLYIPPVDTVVTISGQTNIRKAVAGAIITIFEYPAPVFASGVKVALSKDADGDDSSTSYNPITADSLGNVTDASASFPDGVWIDPGQYDYWITAFGVNNGPYTIEVAPDSAEHGIRYVGDKFATIADAIADLPSTGGQVVTVPNYTETITSQVEVGAVGKPVTLVLDHGTLITCNITDGTSSCFNVHNGSGIIGPNIGNVSGKGGARINLSASANLASVIKNNNRGASGQPFIHLEKLWITGNSTATVTTAMVDLVGILNANTIRDVVVSNFANTIGIHLASNASTAAGPITLDNCFVSGLSNTGARPLVVEAVTNTMLGVTLLGGFYNHPAPGGVIAEFNGNGTEKLHDINIIGTYFEDLTGASTTGLKLRDVSNVFSSGVMVQVSGATTKSVDISQSSAGLTHLVMFSGLRLSSATGINNQITGEAIGSGNIPFYMYDGDGSGTATLDATYSLNGTLTFSHPFDSAHSVRLSSGKAATQQSYFHFADRGTDKWKAGRTGTNMFVVNDMVNNADVFNATAGSVTDINSQASSPVRINRSGGTGGIHIYANSSTVQASIDGSGKATAKGVVIDNTAAPTVGAGQFSLGSTTATTVGAAGGASALPATPSGYLIINIGGTNFKIPYFAN